MPRKKGESVMKLKRIVSVLLILLLLAGTLSTVISANEGVTVYLTVSSDGDFVTSPVTGGKMMRVPIKVPYFDLADYGYEQYYRYETAETGGDYINTTLVEEPTVFHLYIKAIEQYYLGRTYDKETDGEALTPDGGATSLYMLNFWGHSQNLMYFANHEYPLMSSGWGATADYILLEEGMEIDIAMFTDYGFYSYGYFTYFENGDEITVNQGESIDFQIMGASTSTFSGETEPVPLGSDLLGAKLIDANGTESPQTLDSDGKFSKTFDAAGTYYAVAYDLNAGTEFAAIAPAVTKVTVLPAEEKYDVTIKTAPGDINVKFYSSDNGEIPATDMGVTDNYHIYNLQLPEGEYSYRGFDSQGKSFGGMSFEVSGDCEIVLRRTDIYTTTKIDDVYLNENQYTTVITDADGRVATAGDAYLNTYTRYPYLLAAFDNQKLYTIELVPSTELGAEPYNLGTCTIFNCNIEPGTSILTKSGTLPTLVDATITAPEGSNIKVSYQIKNFNTIDITPVSAKTEEGVMEYLYRLPKGNGNYTYRVSKEGKITKAGYLNLASADTAKCDITFDENENPEIRPEYDRTTAIGKRLEDNILLNINPQNYLRLNVGDTFKARAYRVWQIINSDTANIMIEPDFEYKIINGDSVSISPDGQNAIITAVKEGISIIEVTYDAIEIGGKTNYSGIYGAIDPYRHGLFIVNVGGNTETQITMPVWDSDFDTVYFLGDKGEYIFSPTASADMTVTCNGEEIEADGTSYALPINQGNNIVTVTAGDTTEYVVIKGKKLKLKVTENTISFEGLNMPLPKFSGIYNPGFGNTVKASYTDENGNPVTSKGVQYNFITSHSITAENGKAKLSDGTISLSSMGFEPGAHRSLTDNGIGANFSASAHTAAFSRLPDITLNTSEGGWVATDNLSTVISFDGEESTPATVYVRDAFSEVKTSPHNTIVGENQIILNGKTENSKIFVWDKTLSPIFKGNIE